MLPDKLALFEKLLAKKGMSKPLLNDQPPLIRQHVSSAPLSLNQEGLWLAEQLDPGRATYNVPGAIRLTGPLDVAALEQSVLEIIRRHESLRTTFILENDAAPSQVVAPTATFHLLVHDLRELSRSERKRRALSLVTEESRTPFDLEKGPPVRVFLAQLDQDEHILAINMHHIISDGWSMRVLTNELFALYEAFSNGQPSPLADVPIQFTDYAIWQRELLQSKTLMAKLMSYWADQLAEIPPALELPTDRPRPRVATVRGEHRLFELSRPLTDALNALSARTGTTLFVTMLTAFNVLLYALSSQSHIVVGSPFANRDRTELESLIGYFVNMIPIHTDLAGNPNFLELIQRVLLVVSGAHAHREMPFAKLIELINPARNPSIHPLFQVEFTLLDPYWIPAIYGYGFRAPVKQSLTLSGFKVDPVPFESGVSKFDLTILVWPTPNGITGTWEYNVDLFDAQTISRMDDQFKMVLRKVAETPETRIDEIAKAIRPDGTTHSSREQGNTGRRSLKTLSAAKRKNII